MPEQRLAGHGNRQSKNLAALVGYDRKCRGRGCGGGLKKGGFAWGEDGLLVCECRRCGRMASWDFSGGKTRRVS